MGNRTVLTFLYRFEVIGIWNLQSVTEVSNNMLFSITKYLSFWFFVPRIVVV